MPINPTSLRLVKYPPERFVDSTITTLAAGASIAPVPLYLDNLQNRYGLVARLDGVTTDRTASVNLLVSADNVVYPPTGQDAIAQRPLGTPDPDGHLAGSVLSLNFQNIGAAATTNPVRGDWGVWFWPPTISDKIALMRADQAMEQILTPEEIALWRRYAPAGYLPEYTPAKLWREEYARPEVLEWAGTVNVGTGSGVPVSAQSSTISQSEPKPGTFDVVEWIWVDASLGGTVDIATQKSNGLAVNTVRDGEAAPVTYAAAGVQAIPWGSLQHGTAPRVVAMVNQTTYLTTLAALSNVPYWVKVHRYHLQDAQRARWGVDLSGVSREVRDMVRVGVL